MRQEPIACAPTTTVDGLKLEVKLLDDVQGMTWGFTLGELATKSVLRINDKGEWTELAEITIGTRSPVKLMELVVRRVTTKY